MKLRGALLGAGNIAVRGHAPQWREGLADEVEIVAVADLSPANLAAARQLFPEARLYEKAEDVLAGEKLDFCDVCTPPFTHRSLVENAAARGIHILCEKPIAPRVEDAEAIAQAVRAAGITFLPCHQYNHSPQWQAVKRLLPRIGRVHLVEYEVLRTEANPGNPNWAPSWRTDPALAGGGILFDHGAHIFYQLRSVLGEPATVSATVRTLRHSDYGVEDSAFVVLDFGDRLAEVRLTWAARRRAIRFQFIGAEGELVGDDEHLVLHAATTEEVSFGEGLSRNSSHSEWYQPLMLDFVGRIRRGDHSTEPLEEAVYVTRVIALAYESSLERRTRPVSDVSQTAPLVPRALERVTEAMSRVVEEPVPDSPEQAPVAIARRAPISLRVAGLALLLAALIWAGHDMSWSTFLAAAATASPLWITVAAVLNLGAVFAMASRWRALLRPLAPHVGRMDAFKAMIVGFAASIVVPARAGELARAEWLGRRTGLPRATLLGSILLDTLVNAAGMFVGIAALPLVVDLPAWLHSAIWLAVAAFAAAVSVVFLLRPKSDLPAGAARPRTRVERVSSAVAAFLARARMGFAALHDRRALARSFAASLVAWVLEIQVVLFTLHAFDIQVPLGVSLVVLMAVNLALVVPFAPPGNFGTIEIGATLALMEAGVPKEHALVFALAYHFLQVIPIALGGLVVASRSLLRGLPVAEETRP